MNPKDFLLIQNHLKKLYRVFILLACAIALLGDACLILIANTLTQTFGEKVFRFGGDEFAVIFQETASAAGEKIDTVNRILQQAYDNIDLHISAGIYPATAEDTAAEVFLRSDRALYRAKQSGKGIFVIYE